MNTRRVLTVGFLFIYMALIMIAVAVRESRQSTPPPDWRRAGRVDLFLYDRSSGAEITSATVVAAVFEHEHSFGYVVPVTKARGWALWSFDRKGCDTWKVMVDAGPAYPALILERGCFRLVDDGSYFAAYGLDEQKR